MPLLKPARDPCPHQATAPAKGKDCYLVTLLLILLVILALTLQRWQYVKIIADL